MKVSGMKIGLDTDALGHRTDFFGELRALFMVPVLIARVRVPSVLGIRPRSFRRARVTVFGPGV